MNAGPLMQQVASRTDWETPARTFDPLNAEFHFTLDVCASYENRKCLNYFNVYADGLAQSWDDEVCWCNPPYGREIGQWVKKAFYSAHLFGATVVMLVPARTDTKWWHDYAELADERRFIRGRISFSGTGRAPFPSVVLVFRARASK